LSQLSQSGYISLIYTIQYKNL